MNLLTYLLQDTAIYTYSWNTLLEELTFFNENSVQLQALFKHKSRVELAQEYSLKHWAVILIPPDKDLRYGTNGLHQQVAVVICYCCIFSQNMIHVPKRKSKYK